MRKMLRGCSYQKRVRDINRMYDKYAKIGLSNREIWRSYIYPIFAISERQLYNILNASADPQKEVPHDLELYLKFEGEEESNDGSAR